MAAALEIWDDDGDFQGDLFTHSVSTVQTSFSSRLSLHSESNFGDDDWQVNFTPADDVSTINAIQAAKQAGVPIPSNVPSSALIGGTIQRLGKKSSRHKINDDWDDDMEVPSGGLTLKAKKEEPRPSILSAFADEAEEKDDFDEWTDGSLGIRFAGARQGARNRSSSTSAMSPSQESATADSEEDDLRGLELPEGPVDLQDMLKKRQAASAAQTPPAEVQIEHPNVKTNIKAAILSEDHDDFFKDLDVGGVEVFDPKKLTLHRNVKQQHARPTPALPARAPTTTLTFNDKPAATRIPRPVHGGKPQARLEPVFESGATHISKPRPAPPTTTGVQLLRSKRSMPVLRSNYQSTPKPPVPFLPAGSSAVQSHHAKTTAYHLRRDSDPNRAQSPPPRSLSRLSHAYVPDTPSRTSRRPDIAPAALAREAASKKTLTKPQRKRVFGDGTELEIFDDLPTSATKESKFLKQPSARGAPKSLRNIPSRIDLRDQAANGKLSLPDRIMTPMPAVPMTPRSPVKVFQEPSNTPRYLRDTAASRIARESRLANAPGSKPRSDGPLTPITTNWKAQIAARSPHTSPIASRNKGKRVTPGLIRPGETQLPKVEKGMTFNPSALRWEGNENSLTAFDFPAALQTPTPQSHAFQHIQPTSNLSHHVNAPPPSPPRPALIAPMTTTGAQNIQVVGGMVFDPVRMCWLKLKPEQTKHSANLKSPSVTDNEDDDDPFAGIDDLKEGQGDTSKSGTGAPSGGTGGGLASEEWLVGEEFDLGPEFIRRQKDEEVIWRRRCEAWFPFPDQPRSLGEGWRWKIREIAGLPVA